MNPFKALAAPFRTAARMTRLGLNAKKTFDLADQGAEDWDTRRERGDTSGALYRSSAYWTNLLLAIRDTWSDLPLPKEVREMTAITTFLTNYKTTLSGVATIAAALAAISAHPELMFDPKTIMAFSAGIGLIFAKDGNVTGGDKPQTPEAVERVK